MNGTYRETTLWNWKKMQNWIFFNFEEIFQFDSWTVFFFIVDCLLLPQLWKWNMKYWNHRRVVDSYYFKVNFFLYIIFYVWVQTTPLACQNIIFHSSHRSHGLRIDCSSTIWIQIWNPFFPKALSLFLSTSNCILFLNFFFDVSKFSV